MLTPNQLIKLLQDLPEDAKNKPLAFLTTDEDFSSDDVDFGSVTGLTTVKEWVEDCDLEDLVEEMTGVEDSTVVLEVERYKKIGKIEFSEWLGR